VKGSGKFMGTNINTRRNTAGTNREVERTPKKNTTPKGRVC
jgi:hypothetical protein